MKLKIKRNKIEKKDFVDFLNEINDDFLPKLSDKIKFEDYYRKVSNYANIISLYDDKKIIGLMVYYDNFEFCQITLFAISCKYRGKGLGEYLFKFFFEINIKPTRIITWIDNKSAINLYNKIGFESKEIYQNSYGVKEILMEKK